MAQPNDVAVLHGSLNLTLHRGIRNAIQIQIRDLWLDHSNRTKMAHLWRVLKAARAEAGSGCSPLRKTRGMKKIKTT